MPIMTNSYLFIGDELEKMVKKSVSGKCFRNLLLKFIYNDFFHSNEENFLGTSKACNIHKNDEISSCTKEQIPEVPQNVRVSLL